MAAHLTTYCLFQLLRETSDGYDEERSSQSASAERFASFIAEQLITLPTKLEVPASSLFFQSSEIFAILAFRAGIIF